MGPEAYPSGHTTAVMSFALALAIVAPPRLRPLAAAAGALLTVGTVYSILILGGHYPSDIIGGFLVATAWACLAVIPLRPEARPSLRKLAGGPAIAGAVLAAAGAVAVTWRPSGAVAYAVGRTRRSWPARWRSPPPRSCSPVASRLPQGLGCAVGRVDAAREDEQQVREPVEVAHALAR